MNARATATQWIRFLDARDPEDAVGQLRDLVRRLDGCTDDLTRVLNALSGAPADDVEEVLRISRTTTYEAISLLNGAVTRIRLDDPDAA
ncbi:hypothetical protein EKO23_01955 [Nocardioides guangzhouensis]|uniref:Uncharacterized protein n=1 Tax=Nocardioides guangzhouensis TaxID=2497878 RepID=A0A4Q4ZMB4_9ACTN|nr:hypothetical protein [Nocardioides guangzhouensis]RYP88676.1 hypothetical protein EKO23_01955 [Nocardioides guangzhouensis]